MAQVVAEFSRDAGKLPRAEFVAPKAEVDRFSTTLVVENMHCGSCMNGVERALSALPNVTSARANLTTKRVTVVTSDRNAAADGFLEALRTAGYAATALTEQNVGHKQSADNDYLKRLGVAGFAATNVMLLSVSVWAGHGSDMPATLQTLFHWLSALIALPAIAYAGQPFFSSARQALAARRLNMDVPISLGVILATAMSLFQTIRGSEQVYFDAAITLLFFLLIGRVLDERMRLRASSAAGNLLGLQVPVTTVLQSDGLVARVATSSVLPGQHIVIAAGERVPLDGRVIRGGGDVDESLITGESQPRRLAVGDQLYAGTIALTGPFEAEATAVAENTLLAEIAQLMQTAEQARGRYVRLADQAARLYAPMVHILSLVTFAGWMGMGFGWEKALTAAISVLIITCPCALALAVPAVQVVATGRLFRRGIVLKAADGLERLAEIDTIVLDKTGTLTLGRPQLLEPCAVTDETLGLAASLASQSRHPYAKAIVRAAQVRRLAVVAAPGVEEVAGAGLKVAVGGRLLRLGSAQFCGGTTGDAETQTLWFRDGENNPVALPVADAMRPDALDVTQKLTASGYKLEILSGDREAAVAGAARELGISVWSAGQRPDQKIAHIRSLASQGHNVLMVGDGLNDAPALAAGHAALSPATATDISQAAADAVFQGDHLAPVIETLLVARTARRRSLENFAIALGYNAVFVPLAMAGEITPLIAALAMSASSIAVTANALRLADFRSRASS
jgi:P-type Cu2+ transporter